MKLYRDYKKEQEQQLQESSDREAMNFDDNVVIIYEYENNCFTKVKRILFLLLLFLLLGIIAVFIATVFLEESIFSFIAGDIMLLQIQYYWA